MAAVQEEERSRKGPTGHRKDFDSELGNNCSILRKVVAAFLYFETWSILIFSSAPSRLRLYQNSAQLWLVVVGGALSLGHEGPFP